MVRKVNSSMRYSEMIFELAKHLAEAEEDEIVKLKKTLADKISALPTDDNTIRIVNKIEDLNPYFKLSVKLMMKMFKKQQIKLQKLLPQSILILQN